MKEFSIFLAFFQIEKFAKGQGRMDAGDGARSLTSVKSIKLDKRKKRSQYEMETNQGREVFHNLLQDELNSNGILMESSPVVLDRFILSPETDSMQANDPLPPMMYLMLLQKLKESKTKRINFNNLAVFLLIS